jgi:hypothetical protein
MVTCLAHRSYGALERRQQRLADIGGAVLAAELRRLDPLRIRLVDRFLDL